MACADAEILKNEVLDKIEEYLAAERAQSTSSSFDREASRHRAETAHATLAECRRRYWEHIKQHCCDPTSVLSSEPGSMNSIAV